MKPSVYLAGPMFGYVDYNYPAFNYVANYLRHHGYPVVNPADYGDQKEDWGWCIRLTLQAMWSCAIVVLLPSWDDSRGARLEAHVAQELSIPVVTLADFLRDDVDECLLPGMIVKHTLLLYDRENTGLLMAPEVFTKKP